MTLDRPFANTGDKEVFDEASSPTGDMSLEKGFTSLFELTPESGGLFILRQKFNQLMYLVTNQILTNKSDIANSVKLTENQAIDGVKTFTSSPIVPTPTTNFQASTKKYVDDKFSLTPFVPARQTVLNGAVSNGLPAFGGVTGSSTLTASNGSITATCSDGLNNRIGTILNPSWSGLSTNGIMYLYLDIATDGTCTTGSTTLAPIYQFGGTYSTVNGQFTYNIQEAIGKVGNGTVANQVYRVFIGEVAVSGNVVTAITWYAVQGRYDSDWTNTLPASAVQIVKSHNLGIIPNDVKMTIKCLTSDLNYSIGDIVDNVMTANGSSIWSPTPIIKSNKSLSITSYPVASPWALTNKTTGAIASLTNANWAYKFQATRGW